jgi:hypothetical protein
VIEGSNVKKRQHSGARLNALAVLQSCGIYIGADFHTLRSSQVGELLACADLAGYRKPKNANGSRARYFHDLMQRRARA